MKDDLVYIQHIRDAISSIEAYTSDGMKTFMTDKKTQDAVVRNLEIMGEASKNVSAKFKKENPDIPWRQMAGTRDRVIHEYFGVNIEMVWDIIAKDIPDLKEKLKPFLKGRK